MQLTIEVTAENIHDGTPMSATDDPIALAILKVIGPAAAIFVEDTGVRLIEDGPGPAIVVHGDLPRSAREFIEAYDNGHTVHPFTFTIDFIEEM